MKRDKNKNSLNINKNIERFNNKSNKNTIKVSGFQNNPKINNSIQKNILKNNINKKILKKRIVENSKNKVITENNISNISYNKQNKINKNTNVNLNKHKNNILNLNKAPKEYKNTKNINLKKEVSKKSDNKNLQKQILDKEKNLNLSKDLKKNKKQVKNNYKRLNTDKEKFLKINNNISQKLEQLEEIEKEDKSLNLNNKKHKNSRLNFKPNENLKENKNVDDIDLDIKNLKLDEKKFGLEFNKYRLYNEINKKNKLKFEIEKVAQYNDKLEKYEVKNKIKPKISKEIGYANSLPTRAKNYVIDLGINKIHRKINENEDDNTAVKSMHKTELVLERKLTNYLRTSNNRKILKFQKLDRKIQKLEDKKILNQIKNEFKDDKVAYKKAIYKRKQQKILQKKMNKKIQRANIKRIFIRKSKDLLALTKIGSSILNLILSIKTFIIALAVFLIFGLIVFVIVIIMLLSSVNIGSGDLYEIQKAELYYRELEAKAKFYENKYIDHDPIHLASFLTCIFGEFTFDETVQSFLDELLEKQASGKSLEQLVSDSLTSEEYEIWQQLNETKLNFIKYGSPFQVEYESRITSYIGYRINPTSADKKLQLHKGLDIGMAGGTPILAISDGTITRANFSNSYGNIVEIRHDDGYLSKYAHQQKLNVIKGQKVKKGDIIGFVGTTGDSTGNHLHLELYDENGEFMNPIFVIER